MKKVLFVLVFILFGSFTAVQAQTSEIEVGPSFYYFKYEEPGLMQNTGMMAGIKGSYTYKTFMQFKAEADMAYGIVDYESNNTGKADNEDNSLFEPRILAGYDFFNNGSEEKKSSFSFVPYIGLGYRYLNNDSSGKTTTTGHSGYERESNYIYSPMGIEFTKLFGLEESDSKWSIGLIGEYDCFIWGRQISHLSDVNSNFGDIKNTQKKGYGFRASLKIKKQSEKIDFVIEPFFRYWNIKKSEEKNIYYSGSIWGYGWEPKNNTQEIGFNISVLF